MTPGLRTTGIWRSLDRRIQIPHRPCSFSSFPGILHAEGNEENHKEGNWNCAASRSLWSLLLRSEHEWELEQSDGVEVIGLGHKSEEKVKNKKRDGIENRGGIEF
jgi:hypothetical protein